MIQGRSILSVPGLSATSSEFRSALYAMAERNGWNADAIAAVMSIETGHTFAPDAGWKLWHPKRTATGLIQFIESTARRLGVQPASTCPAHPELELKGAGRTWATWRLMGMTATEQLPLVELYFRRAFENRKPTRPADYYLAVFGAAPGLGNETVIATQGETRYDQNKGLDRNEDGRITVSDIGELMAGTMGSSQRLAVGPAPSGSPFPGASSTSTASMGLADVVVGIALAYGPVLIKKVVTGGR